MTDRPPDVTITGEARTVHDVEDALGTNLIAALAYAARQHDVMISVTVSPYESTTIDDADA